MTARAWLAVLSLTLGSFSFVTSEFLPVGILPQVSQSFGISAGAAGLMMTIPGILAALSAFGVMLLAGNADRRRVLQLLSLLLVLSSLLAAWAPSYAVMLASRVLLGIGLGAFWALSLAVTSRLVPPSAVPMAASAVFGGVTAAMIFGVPLGTYLAEAFSWRAAFLVTAALAAVALAMQLWALPPLKTASSLKLASLAQFMRQPAARRSIATIVLVFIAQFGSYTYLAPLVQRVGITGNTLTALLLGYGIAGFIANFLVPRFAAKSVKFTLAGAVGLLMLSLLALPATRSPTLTMALVMLWGIAWGALPLSLNLAHRQVPGGETEAASATFTGVIQVAIALGAGVGGMVVDSAGISADFLAAGLFALPALLMALGVGARAGSDARSMRAQCCDGVH